MSEENFKIEKKEEIALLAGDYIINSNGTNDFFSEKRNTDFGVEVKLNKSISLGNVRKIKDLEEYYEFTSGEKLIENSIVRNEITDELIINLLEWDKRRNGGKEIHIINPLIKRGIITSVILDWILENRENRENDHVLLPLIENNILTSEQIKNTLLKGRDGFVKSQLIKKGLIFLGNFTEEEKEEMFFNLPVDQQYYLFENFLFGFKDEKRRKDFIEKTIIGLLDFYKNWRKENEIQEGMSEDFTTMLPQECQFLISSITENYNYLTDEKMIELIKNDYVFTSNFSKYMPGYVFKGLILFNKETNDLWEQRSLEDYGKDEYKEKYELMEKIFNREPVLEEILTKEEINEIIDEVKDYGYKLFNPIYITHRKEEDIINFKHVSGVPNLDILLPDVARDTARGFNEYAVYLQDSKYEDWQIEHLKKVNKGKLYIYSVSLPKSLLIDNLICKDERWKGGYFTTQPIILNSELKLNWDLFNLIMKTSAIRYYEKIFGNLPNKIKEKLMRTELNIE